MGNLTTALIIVMAINTVMFITQFAILDINPSASQFYKCSDSTMLSAIERNACQQDNYSINYDNINSQIPNTGTEVSSATGNIFTDTFSAMRTWLLDSLGLSYIIDIVKAPYTFVRILLVPPEIAFIIAGFWYALTFFLFVNWIRGGDA